MLGFKKNIRKKWITILFVVFVSLLSFSETKAQVNEFGLNVGLIGNRYTVSQNRLNADRLLRQGRIRYTPRIGAQLTYGGPKDQNVRYFSLKHGLLIEPSLCRCGGNTEILTSRTGGGYSLNYLTYVTWQADISVMYMAKLKKLRFLGGPTFTYNYYRSVKLSANGGEFRSASGQINDTYIGYELGFGVRDGKSMFSARYHTAITEFGGATEFIPASYNIHQVRLIFSYFLSERSTEKNWGSIYQKR